MHSYLSSREVGGSTMTSCRTTGVKFGVLDTCSVTSNAVAFVGLWFSDFDHNFRIRVRVHSAFFFSRVHIWQNGERQEAAGREIGKGGVGILDLRVILGVIGWWRRPRRLKLSQRGSSSSMRSSSSRLMRIALTHKHRRMMDTARK